MPTSPSPRSARWALLFASFAGSYLLFTVELLIANLLTPRFGGGAVTWLTALMVFQVVLFLGYAYAHLIAHRLGRWHLLTVVICGLALPITIPAHSMGGHPIIEVVWAISAAVVLPFFALSTTSVVTQVWWTHSPHLKGEPYPIYAASNLGSAVSLLAYPLVIEATLSRSTQTTLWLAGYILFGLTLAAAWRLANPRMEYAAAQEVTEKGRAPVAAWIALSAIPSALLLGTTSLITTDVGSFPLLWTMPLLAYLISFVLVFGGRWNLHWLVRRWPEAIALGCLAPSIRFLGEGASILALIGTLFWISTALHQMLYDRRPPSGDLTRYYLWISAGGGLGGIAGNLLPPMLLPGPFEYPIILTLCVITMLWLQGPELWRWMTDTQAWRGGARLAVWMTCAASYGFFLVTSLGNVANERSVYGSIRVMDVEEHGRTVRTMAHGHTNHGASYLDEDPPRALGYYYIGSGMEQAHQQAIAARAGGPVSAVVIGLGTGSMASYNRPGDTMRIYELDPNVSAIAQSYFPYLDAGQGEVEVIIADGLLGLQSDPRTYDILTVDAFSGDAIPFNLMTLEALETYLEAVGPEGIVVLHVSNRFYDFPPILARATEKLGTRAATAVSRPGPDDDPYFMPNSVFAFSQDKSVIDGLLAQGWVPAKSDGRAPWTEDFLNPLEALVWVRERLGWR